MPSNARKGRKERIKRIVIVVGAVDLLKSIKMRRMKKWRGGNRMRKTVENLVENVKNKLSDWGKKERRENGMQATWKQVKCGKWERNEKRWKGATKSDFPHRCAQKTGRFFTKEPPRHF